MTTERCHADWGKSKTLLKIGERWAAVIAPCLCTMRQAYSPTRLPVPIPIPVPSVPWRRLNPRIAQTAARPPPPPPWWLWSSLAHARPRRQPVHGVHGDCTGLTEHTGHTGLTGPHRPVLACSMLYSPSLTLLEPLAPRQVTPDARDETRRPCTPPRSSVWTSPVSYTVEDATARRYSLHPV